jgi:hypothetical protein
MTTDDGNESIGCSAARRLMRRLKGYSLVGVLRLTGADLALFEEIRKERRSERRLEPRGYWRPPPERIVMYYSAKVGKATPVKCGDDLKRLINAVPDITTAIVGAEEIASAVIACVANLGLVIPGKPRSFAPAFYGWIGIDPEDPVPQLQNNVLRFACWRPRPFWEDAPLVSVTVRFNSLDWQTSS